MALVHSHSTISMFEQCPLKFYRLRIAKDVQDTSTKASIHGDAVHVALEDRIKDKKELPKEYSPMEQLVASVEKAAKETNQIIKSEYMLGLTKEYKGTGFFSSNVYIRAKLDVAVIGNQRATVLDWKTGKRKFSTSQLEIGALSIMGSHNVEHVNAAFVWIKDKAMDKIEFHRNEFTQLKKKLENRIKHIEIAEEENEWTAKPSYLCNYCACKPTCKYAL